MIGPRDAAGRADAVLPGASPPDAEDPAAGVSCDDGVAPYPKNDPTRPVAVPTAEDAKS